MGIVGGVLAGVAGVAALIIGTSDTAVIGGWITLGAALVGIAGALFVETRPGSAALLFATSAATAGLVAPGVIAAIADNLTIFLSYLTAGVLLIATTVLALASRQKSDERGVHGAV
jgi:hypothetical protein